MLRNIPDVKCVVCSIIFLITFSINSFSQNSDIYESFAILNINGSGNSYYDLKASTANPDLQGANLGSYSTGINTLILNGAQNKVYKCASDNITRCDLWYRIYKNGATPPSFTSTTIFYTADLGIAGCGGVNQQWESSAAGINVLNGLTPGNYFLEVYTTADFTYPTGNGTHYANNSGANYIASFTVNSLNVDVLSGANIIGTYSSLKGAFDKINDGTHQGALTLRLNSSTNETATAILNASGMGSANYTSVLINPSGSIIVSGDLSANALVILNGADNVTIDGLNTGGNSLKFVNNSNGTINTSTIRFQADATLNVITNCSILGSGKVGVASNGGNIYFATGTTTGNDNNTLTNCNIGPGLNGLPSKGIYSFGSSASIDNSGIIISNCNIYDCFDSTNTSAGIFVSNFSSNFSISGNKFYQTSTRAHSLNNLQHSAIWVSNTSGNGFLISGNTVGYSTGTGTGKYILTGTNDSKFYPIALSAGFSAASTIQNNIITSINLNYLGTTTGASANAGIFCGIYVIDGLANVTNNTIGAASGTSAINVTSDLISGNQVNGICTQASFGTSLQSNTIASITATAGTTNGIVFNGIITKSSGYNTILNNIIGSATSGSISIGTSNTSGACTFYGINNGSTGTLIIGNTSSSGNTVNNIIINGTNSLNLGVGINNSAITANPTLNYNTISNITIYSTGGNLYGFYNGGGVTGTVAVSYNTFSGFFITAPTTSLIFRCIHFNNANAGSTLNITNNSLQAVNYSGNSTGEFSFINQSATVNSATISNNATSSLILPTSSATTYIIYQSNATPNITVTNNNFSNISKNANGATSNFYGYYNIGSPTSGNALVTGNTFSNISFTNGLTTFYGIHVWTTTSQTIQINNNTITTISGGSTMYGISHNSGAFGSTLSNNLVNNISGSSNVYAISVGSSAGGTALNVNNNVVNTIASSGNSSVYGIQHLAGTSTNIYKNKVYDIYNSNTGINAFADGIYINGGTTVNIYNNLIGDIRSASSNPTTSAPTAGIFIASGTTLNVYYNTVYLNSTITGTNAGSAALSCSVTPTLTMRNNILVNVSTKNGTGLVMAFRRTSTTITSYSTSSNNNIFYAGPPAAGNVIYSDGTNTDISLAAYQARITPRDANSYTELPPFVSTVGSNSNYLHISTTVGTQAESSGQPISGYNDDYDGDVRNASKPDIGADEFAGLLISCFAPTNLVANPTSSTAALSWSAPTSGTPTGYQWEVRTSNGPGTGATGLQTSGSTTSPTTSATAIGLTASTTYYFYVRTNCGGGNFSVWAGPVVFTTPCASVNVPYTENFNTAVVPNLPPCTSRQDVNNDGTTWTTVTAPAGYTGNTLRYSYHLTNAANDWFYTNGLNLSGGISYRLTFVYGNNSSTYTEKLKVYYGNAAVNTSMTTLLLDFPTIKHSTTVFSASVDFTPSTTGVYYIGFQAYSDANQLNLYVDDISVVLTPSASTDYFRTIATGSWTSTTTWETSKDNVNWQPATITPDNNATAINIRSPHTISLGGSTTARKLTIEAGGNLNTNNNLLTITDAAGTDLNIAGILQLWGKQPVLGTGTAVVQNGGSAKAVFNSSPAESDDFAYNGNVTFLTGSVFEWNNTSAFEMGRTYFPNAITDMPIFKVTKNVSGFTTNPSSTTTFNGLFQVDSTTGTPPGNHYHVKFDNSGDKIFKYGIGGTDTLTHTSTSGRFIFASGSPTIYNTIKLNIENSNVGVSDLEVQAGVNLSTSGTPTIKIGSSTNPGADFLLDGSFTHNGSIPFDLSYGNLNIAGTGVINSGSGTLSALSTNTNINVTGASGGSSGTLKFTPGNSTIKNLSLSRTGTASSITMGSDMGVSGIATLASGNLNITANALTLSGTILNKGGFFNGTSSSNITIGGTGSSVGTLAFATGGNTLNNLTLNRTGGTNTDPARRGIRQQPYLQRVLFFQTAYL